MKMEPATFIEDGLDYICKMIKAPGRSGIVKFEENEDGVIVGLNKKGQPIIWMAKDLYHVILEGIEE